MILMIFQKKIRHQPSWLSFGNRVCFLILKWNQFSITLKGQEFFAFAVCFQMEIVNWEWHYECDFEQFCSIQ
jgi:hypothetical protein